MQMTYCLLSKSVSFLFLFTRILGFGSLILIPFLVRYTEGLLFAALVSMYLQMDDL